MSRPWYKSPFLWAAVVGLIAIPAIRPFFRRVPDPPPVLWTLPAFQFVNQAGDPFGSAELRGQVYLASFFFTRCPTICAALTRSLRQLQDRFEQLEVDVRLLSVTVDPEHDQPSVLKAYGERNGADFERWTFLTGQEKAIRALIEEGFKSHVGKKRLDSAGTMDIAHSGALALVDQSGRLRGLYSTDKEGLDEAFHRSIHVLTEKR